MEKILLVEDDSNLSMMIIENLEDLNFEVVHLVNGEEVLSHLEQESFDLILMDIDFGCSTNGFDIAESIREKDKFLPILFTTAKKSTSDLERGFSIGCMDYLKKPFGIRELNLRMNSLLKKENLNLNTFQLGSSSFDNSCQSLTIKEKVIKLTKLESTFLSLLCKHTGKVVTKDAIIKVLWEYDDDPQGKVNSLHNLAYKLRKVLEIDPMISLETISKNGYQLVISK